MAIKIQPIQKPVVFEGSSREDLHSFPPDARLDLGYQLDLVQPGHAPTDWKAMPTVGAGVMDIRCEVVDGAFRVAYAVKFQNAIYVLHAFQKKTMQTSKHDQKIIRARLSALVERKKSER